MRKVFVFVHDISPDAGQILGVLSEEKAEDTRAAFFKKYKIPKRDQWEYMLMPFEIDNMNEWEL